MKNDGKVNFVEKVIYSLKIVTKLKRKQNFQFWKFQKCYSMKNDGKVIFVENSIYSLILNTKLKRIQNFSIFKI